MADSLFDSVDDQKRAAMRALGWHEAAGYLGGRMMWRDPAGNLFSEEEAFKRADAAKGGQEGGDVS